MKEKIWIYILFATSLFSCEKTHNPIHDKIIYVDIEKNKIKEFDSLNVTKFVVLETNDDVLIEDVYRVSVIDSCILIFDGKLIYLFSESGRFIRQIGTQGPGPNEYYRIDALYIDIREKTIYIADMNKQCIFVFDLQGKIIDKTKINNYFFNDFIKIGNNYLIHSVSNFNNSEGYALRLVDDSFNKTIVGYLSQKNFFVSSLHQSYFMSKDTINYFFYSYNNTIYTLSEDSIIPMLKIDLGEKEIPFEILKNIVSLDDYHKLYDQNYWGNIESYLFCRNDFYFTISKISKQASNKYSVRIDLITMRSDVFHSYVVYTPLPEIHIPFKEIPFTYPIASYNDNLIYIIYPFMLDENSIKLLKEENLDVDEESNPILFFVSDSGN